MKKTQILFIFLLTLSMIGTIHRVQAQSPGGVSSNLTVWVKANAGITGTSPITNWADQASGFNWSPTGSPGPTLSTNIAEFNYNPSVSFNGSTYFGRTIPDNNTLISPNSGTMVSVFNGGTELVYNIAKANVNASGPCGASRCNSGYRINSQFGDNTLAWAAPVTSGIPDIGSIRAGTVSGSTTHENSINGTRVERTGVTFNRQNFPYVAEIGRFPGFNYTSNISEVINYNVRLNNAQLNQVESYLALKYGVTLNQSPPTNYTASNGSTLMWDSSVDATYNNDIFGIGTDTGSELEQRVSNSVNSGAILDVSTTNDFTSTNQDGSRTSLGNLTFQTFAHNGGATTLESSEINIGSYRLKLIREWQAQETGTVGSVFLRFPGFNNNYALVVDDDGDFSSGATIVNSLDNNGVIQYDFTDEEYFTLAALDTDDDEIPDFDDIDDDNDGVLDVDEQNSGTDIDTDGDGVVDRIDLDSDNDGVTDIVEAGGTDSTVSGRVDDDTDTDGDGWANTFDPDNGGTPLTDPDTDADGILNRVDLDSDNDGIVDIIEAGGTDTDNDGRVDDNTDTDGDGWSDVFDPNNGGTPLADPDTDGGSSPNRIDIDSDNDRCSDANEYYNRPGADGGDGDGEIGNSGDAGFPTVDTNGLVTNNLGGPTFTYINDGSSNYTDSNVSSACVLSLTGADCWRTLASPNFQAIGGSPLVITYAEYFAQFTGGAGGGANGLWTQGNDGSRGTTFGDPNVYTMNAAGTEWVEVPNLNAPFTPGTGVLISVFSDNDYDGTDDGWPKEADLFYLSNQTELGNRPYEVDVTAGYNMVGNPFNSAVTFAEITRSSTIAASAWVYDRTAPDSDPINEGNSGGWRSINGSGVGDIDDAIIAAGQGFVVQATGSGELGFGEDDKVDPGTPAADSGTFYGKTSENEKQLPDHLRLEVRGASVYNSAWVQFTSEGAASEIIDGDVEQFYPFEQEYGVLSTLKQGQLLDIGHFPYPGSDDFRIPLTLETTSTGPMTLELTDLQYNGSTLYLHDTETGESVELTEGATYSFTPSGTPAKSRGDCYSTPMGFTGPQKDIQASPRFYISAEAALNSGGPELPSEYGLDQNYPNPFNPTTQITYQLPRQADVRLEVFDMAGRQVATLVSQTVSAGTHTVNFDGSILSSGVYMYRLQAGSTLLTRKLTIIK